MVKLASNLEEGMRKSKKKKQEELDDLVERLRTKAEAREVSVNSNKIDLKKQDREKIKYFNQRAKERDNSVKEM